MKIIFILLFINTFSLVDASNETIHNLNSNSNKASFEENKGQIKGFDGQNHPEVKFLYQKGNLKLFLLKDGIAYQFEKQDSQTIETYRMDMQLEGANPDAEIITEGKSIDYTNFYNHNALAAHSFQKNHV